MLLIKTLLKDEASRKIVVVPATGGDANATDYPTRAKDSNDSIHIPID